MIEQLENIIEKAEKNGLTCFGIRHHQIEDVVSVGDELGTSTNTIDDQEDEELNGICCLGVDDIDTDCDFLLGELKDRNYQDGQIVLVGGTSQEYGNDQNESIIENAEVLWVF